MLQEFRDFLMRGNLVELAIAFVMGAAFAALVTSFVDDLIMPIIAMILGKPSFDDLTFTINDAVFSYGSFITAAITFATIAAAVFFVVVKPYDGYTARRPDRTRRSRTRRDATARRWPRSTGSRHVSPQPTLAEWVRLESATGATLGRGGKELTWATRASARS
jgi:large conductance mechanosensitive channel